MPSTSALSRSVWWLPRPPVPFVWARFVEDRYETLEGVSLSMLGAPVSLYLADWGYNTERTRKRAERNPLVQVLSLSDFCTKMQ